MGKYRGIQVRRNMTLIERLDFYSIPEPNSGCWLWLGSYHRNGYGHMSWLDHMTTTNRLAWIAHRGEIPDGLHVLHKCDVPACVNPNHLFLGTHRDNMHDRSQKGRYATVARGERQGSARLTQAAVVKIRASTESYSILAKRYGVSKSLIWHVHARKIWKHI